MAGSDPTLLGAMELRDRIAARELSPVALIEAALERVERHNGELNAIVTLSGTALDQARDLEAALETGVEPGPLCGLPVGIEDRTPVRGLRFTEGSALFGERVAEQDAVVVQRLRDAGAIILGKTGTTEFGVGGNAGSELFGHGRNPWDPTRSPGESAGGGAAALASGMIALAEGPDLGGSLAISAACCGVLALRPTPGLIPTWPTVSPWDTLQATGLMARRAEDLALALQAVGGPSPRAPIGQPIRERDFGQELEIGMPAGTRIGYCPKVGGVEVDPAREAVCAALVERLSEGGAKADTVEFDISWARGAFEALRGYWLVVQQAERLDERERFGETLRLALEAGLELDPSRLAGAEADRGRLWEVFQRFFGHFDFLLTPAEASAPGPVDEPPSEDDIGRAVQSQLPSLTGLPVGTAPAGLDPDGLPVGIQIVGPRAGEGRVLGIASVIRELSGVETPPGF